MDSTDSGILLNSNGIATTEDYLIISNLHKDTIFDIFDIDSLKYIYSALTYGQGGNDMLPFRWMRPFDKNEFYTIGFGVLFAVSRDGKTMFFVKSDNDHIFRCDLSMITEGF